MSEEVDITTNGGESGNVLNGTVQLEVQTNPKQEYGCCCLKSHYQSNKSRSCTDCCPSFCADCWQSWENIRWKCSFVCMKQPFGSFCMSIWPRFARASIGNIIFTCFLIFVQIYAFNEHYEDLQNSELDGTTWFRTFGLGCGSAAGVNYSFTVLLGQRNTLINLLFGLPLERAIKYHRYTGLLAIFWSYLHFIGMVQFMIGNKTFSDEIIIEQNLAGLIALSSITLIFIFTLEYFRRNHWELFLKSHWFLFLTFWWAISKHDVHFTPSEGIFFLAAMMWLIDLIWRFIISFIWGKPIKVQNIEYLPGGVIKLLWKQKEFIYEGGQYCFICIPAIDLTQWHPFSISSSPDDDETHFHIRALGDFTERLALLAKQPINDWSKLQFYLEGPYGRPEIAYEDYDNLLLISGGIGITPMQSIWGSLMSSIKNGTQYKQIHFVWYIRDPKMVPEFDQIHWNAVKRIGGPNAFNSKVIINGTNLITTYCFTKINEDSNDAENLKNLYSDGAVFGRPSSKEFINQAKSTLKNDDKLGVLGCGPAKLLEDMKNHCAEIGVDCHSEVFTF